MLDLRADAFESGTTLCRRIRETHPVPIIMVTAKSTENDVIVGPHTRPMSCCRVSTRPLLRIRYSSTSNSLSGNAVRTPSMRTSFRETHPVPIIMVTAKSTENDVIVGLEIGADDYVTKPSCHRWRGCGGSRSTIQDRCPR